MTTTIAVLDHGFVRLVSYMQPAPKTEDFEDITKAQEGWSGDLEIVRNARVSYDADWRTTKEGGDKDEKLIGYMYHNKHTSPFEAMVFTFEIKCPLFIARQWHRHRTWSYNEVSARYTELPDDYYIPDASVIGQQDPKNKQARTFMEEDRNHVNQFHFRAQLAEHSKNGHALYQEALELGIPRELARTFLSVNTYTRYFGTVDLHNLIHFCLLRSDSHAQWEIQQYSNALIRLVKPVCPIAVGHLIDELHARSLDESPV